jgi:hypothetical protein
MRLTRKALKAAHEEEYFQMRLETELILYPYVLQNFIKEHPESGG